MSEAMMKRCEKFFESREEIKKAYKWENDSLISVCASVFINKGIDADEEKMKECKALLKAKTSVFSNFRSTVECPMVSLMAVAENSEEMLTKAMKYYEALKNEFHGSEYLVLAAAILAEQASEEQIDGIVARAKKLYKLMKEKHPILTSSEDSVYAVLLGISDKADDEALIEEAETAYRILKETFSSSNDVQAVANILALADGNVEEKCAKLISLFNGLKDAGVKYGKYEELATLATLSILPVSVETMIGDLMAVEAEMTEHKPYKGLFALDKKTRLMHAAMIASSEYSNSEDASIAAMTGTLAMIAAQHAAMCAVMCASIAASSAAAASN